MKNDCLVLDSLAASALAHPRKEAWIAIRSDDAPGDGSRGNPYRANTASEFDLIMATKLSDSNIRIHLGPGLFRTRGSQGWLLREGQTLSGQGMYNTTLRLEPVPVNSTPYGVNAIQGVGVFGCCVSDLTIDCNLGRQKKFTGQDYAKVSPNAMRIVGQNNRAQRVRVINFGTTATNNEGFPMNLGTHNALIEDCIFEQPYRATIRESSIINLGNDDEATLPPQASSFRQLTERRCGRRRIW